MSKWFYAHKFKKYNNNKIINYSLIILYIDILTLTLDYFTLAFCVMS